MNCRKQISIVFATVLAAAGCAVGPNYSRPTAPMQSAWKEKQIATNTTKLSVRWWESFKVSKLNELEDQAIAANQDLKRAVARVTEARALARIAKADLLPTISKSGGYSYNRLSDKRATTLGKNVEFDDFSSSFDLNYELDVWGRVRRSVEAATADEASIERDRDVVLLTLTADVARNYYLIRSFDQERRIVQSTVALRKDTLQIQQTRYDAGLINQVDVTRAETEMANVEADLQSIIRSRAQIEHALAVLCGKAPGEFQIVEADSAFFAPEIPVGMPSELLQRRPDIASAEERLHAATARIGVAKAAFFPTIKLTGAAGLASADLGTFVSAPSRLWSVGPGISVPVFEGGRNRANLKAAQARVEQSTADYRSVVLGAFREVEDSLSDLATLTAEYEAVSRAQASAKQTAALAQERYDKGLANYLDVVDAQRTVLQAERQQAQLSGQRAVTAIQLAKAVGGGWRAL